MMPYMLHAYYYRLLQAELDHVLSSRDANGHPAAPRAAAAVPRAAAAVPRAAAAVPRAAAVLVPRTATAPPHAAARAPSLLDALMGVRCSAEESLVPLLVLRSRQV